MIPIGASTGRGALGYALAMVELGIQLENTAGLDPASIWIFTATSSGGTLAGMVLGASLLGWRDTRIVAVSADDPADEIRERVLGLARDGAELIGYQGDLAAYELTVTDAYVGEGYGVRTAASLEATKLLARSEGVLLDPTYTAKAAAGMADWVRSGRVASSARIVFWHTGGQPGLLA